MNDLANVKREDKRMSICYKGGSSMIGKQGLDLISQGKLLSASLG